MQIKRVGVLGCGLMGSGIAQVCEAAGYKTTVREVSQILLDNGIGRIQKFVEDGVAKGKVTAAARDTTLGNLSGTTTFEGLKDCDLIIEAIVENLEDKQQTYRSLEKIVKKETIFLSNTSSLCITELAAELKADLIVLPSHGRTGLKRLLIGSVAERVVRLAHCPVLVLRS